MMEIDFPFLEYRLVSVTGDLITEYGEIDEISFVRS